jgi:isopentenyl-diphosphate delta-isomerase
MQRTEIVSNPAEKLILVDSDDREIGALPKSDCHVGDGILHRAFSIFVFNSGGDVLLQKRSADKPLWPMYWSNACCSHPRSGESMEVAVRRRMREELGVDCPLTFLYKFEYQAAYEDIGSERELCSVYIGESDGPFDPNRAELADLRFFPRDELAAMLAQQPLSFTPWFKMEWERISTALDENDGRLERLRISSA